MAAYVLRVTSAAEARATEAHVAVCAPCAADLAWMRPVVAALGSVRPPRGP